MEMLVIAVIALGAFAAVLYPLFRRRPGVGAERGSEDVPPAEAEAAPLPQPRTVGGEQSDDELETEVRRYREAVRAGTVCRKCGQANPRDSRFCYECGAPLPLADAQEFE